MSLVSLLIPTMNRSDFLIRLLHYYNEQDFKGAIFIADSSDSWHAERVGRAIATMRGRLQVLYRSYPGVNNALCIKDLLALVSTPYVAMVPDDDFLMPGAVEACIEFLERSPDYVSAHGLGLLFTVDSDAAHGQVSSVAPYGMRAIEENTATERLLAHLSNYSVTLFSVHRTETMRLMYDNACGLEDKVFETEMIPCCLSAVLGKSKRLNCLYLARQVHGRRTQLPSLFQWITRAGWSSAYQFFRASVARELSRKDDVGIDEAGWIVDRAFCSYLACQLTDQWRVGHGFNMQRYLLPLRRWAKLIPGLRELWHQAWSLVPGDKRQISLERLMRNSSSYHGDFTAVHRAVTAAPEIS